LRELHPQGGWGGRGEILGKLSGPTKTVGKKRKRSYLRKQETRWGYRREDAVRRKQTQEFFRGKVVVKTGGVHWKPHGHPKTDRAG